MAKTIDATKIPAKVTIKNPAAEVEVDKDNMNKYEGFVRIPVYRVLTQEVELAPQDKLQLIVTTSAELLFYRAVAKDQGLEINVEEA